LISSDSPNPITGPYTYPQIAIDDVLDITSSYSVMDSVSQPYITSGYRIIYSGHLTPIFGHYDEELG
jgi:hypothetical protein